MAEKNHSTVARQSLGNLTLSIIDFTDIDTGDTYDSGIPAAVSYWVNGTDASTTILESTHVSYSQDVTGSSKNVGRFTFTTEEADRAIQLYVLSRT